MGSCPDTDIDPRVQGLMWYAPERILLWAALYTHFDSLLFNIQLRADE